MVAIIKRANNQAGASLVECAVLVGLVAVVALAAIASVGEKVPGGLCKAGGVVAEDGKEIDEVSYGYSQMHDRWCCGEYAGIYTGHLCLEGGL